MDDLVAGMAEAVEARRRALGLDPGKFAEAAGLTRQGAGRVRNGHRRKYQDSTINGVAKALRWERDWYDRLLSGEPPVEDDRADRDLLLSDRVARIEERQDAMEAQLDEILRRLPEAGQG